MIERILLKMSWRTLLRLLVLIVSLYCLENCYLLPISFVFLLFSFEWVCFAFIGMGWVYLSPVESWVQLACVELSLIRLNCVEFNVVVLSLINLCELNFIRVGFN